MGKHDSAVGFATAMGVIIVFGFLAYAKSKRRPSDDIHAHAPADSDFHISKEYFPPGRGSPVAIYGDTVTDPYTEKKSGCGCGH